MKTRTPMILLVATVLFSFNTSLRMNMNDENPPIRYQTKEYEELWDKVHEYDSDGLPKSALEAVDRIFEKAQADDVPGQVVKALIYKMKYTVASEDEGAYEKEIYKLEDMVGTAKFPYKNLYHLMLAKMYWMYFEGNRWQFYDRSETVNFDNKDMATWSLPQLVGMVSRHYMAALADSDKLKRTRTEDFDDILSGGNMEYKYLPSLFDFIASEATLFFSNSDAGLSRPAQYFQLQEEGYFAPAADFARMEISTEDTASFEYKTVKIYQQLLAHRLANANIPALLDADRRRLEYAYSESVSPIKDSLYLKALNRLTDQYPDQVYTDYLNYLKAEYYYNQATSYDPVSNPIDNLKDYYTIAHGIASQVIEKRGEAETKGKHNCEELIESIEKQSHSFSNEQYHAPDQSFPIRINYQNTNKIYMRVGKVDQDLLDEVYSLYDDKEEFEMLRDKMEMVKEYELELPLPEGYNTHYTEHIIDGLPLGTYVLLSSANQAFDYSGSMAQYSTLNITGLSCLTRTLNSHEVELRVMGRMDGKPVEGAEVQVLTRDYNSYRREYEYKKGPRTSTDKDGLALIDERKISDNTTYYIQVTKGGDILLPGKSYYSYHYYDDDAETTTFHTYYYTDRSIYRPGQTVYFKAIGMKEQGGEYSLRKNTAITVEFFDANSQKIEELKLTSNEYGSVAGQFTIPTGLLNGTMFIRDQYGSKTFRVEEYKRPKFEAGLDDFDGSYRVNDQVEVSGTAKSYAGANITDAQVKYRVERRPRWRGWWWYPVPGSAVEITNGNCTTDEKGAFKFSFEAIPDLSLGRSPHLAFQYTIYVDVTDLNGETRSTSGTITVGYTVLALSTNMPDEYNTDGDKELRINTMNLNGEFITANGTINVYKLKEPASAKINPMWSRPDQYVYSQEEWQTKTDIYAYTDETDPRKVEKGDNVLSMSFDTEKDKVLEAKKFQSLPQGRYMIEISSTDKYGTAVTQKEFFMAYSTESDEMPIVSNFWYAPVNYYCKPGEVAIILIGSSKQSIVLVETEHRGKIVDRQWLKLDNEQKLLEFPVEEKHRGNFSIHVTMLRDGRLYSRQQMVYVPYDNKRLQIEFESFRDKLQPGAEETWRIKINGPGGERVAAEMLIGMYDKSLDQFVSHYWNFDVLNHYYTEMPYTSVLYSSRSSSSLYSDGTYMSLIRPGHYSFDWHGFNYWSARSYRYYSKSGTARGAEEPMMEADAVMSMDMAEAEEAPSPTSAKRDRESKPGGKNAETNERTEDRADSGEMPEVKTRTNLNETALFTPQLRTDEEGRVIVEFTMPEALTTWKMLGLAYTKDLKYSMIQKELITQKELMVMPNPPRFFRENDRIVFPAKISNVSEKNLTGKAKLEILNAMTMEPMQLSEEPMVKEFSVDAGMNTLVSWELSIPDNLPAAVYRVSAVADKFSDGEEAFLPVLSNRIMVTETMPLPVRGNETKTFEFTKLVNSGSSSTLKHHKLTLEFTSNPAWYAVQALPYLMEYPHECNEQIFSRYYANSLATHIANSDPKIKNVFEAWKNTPGSEALLSNLEKNQELKQVVLEATPWVLNAQDESQRKRRVGLLFDLARMSGELDAALRKLKQNQYSNGGWPWFDRMPDNRYITQHIVCGFGHLGRLGVVDTKEDEEIEDMLSKAVNYLDERMVEDYEDLKKYYDKEEMKKDRIGYTQIHYLYTRSFYLDIPVKKSHREAFEYFKGQAETYWVKKSKYMQGMIALAIKRFDPESAIPGKVVASLREHAIMHEELGMYWKDIVGGYYWYQAPIETMALMIEVFDEVAQDQEAVEELKIWLLKNKQTNDWETTKATSEAIYALLLQGTGLLASEEIVSVQLGKITVDPKTNPDIKTEAGTGYYKTSWSSGEITPEMGRISVTKKDAGVAWGAVYWQYFEQLDKITPAETPLKLNKKLFVERDTERGPVIEAIDNEENLKIGDKVIVRIELRVDREMEFIHMRDMRAAGFEPINVLSHYKYQDGLGYYESTRDASTDFFIAHLPKGTFVFEYPLRVSHQGDFSNGITTIQCMYAPEFASHSEGLRVKVVE